MNALYGLKFLAFLFIFFHHLAFPHSLGSVFTTFFFVFAGFITAYSFIKKQFKPSKKNIKKFYKEKIIKNYPIYIITLLISIPFVIKASNFNFTFKDLFIHTFMLQTIIPQGENTFMFNGLSWFMVDLLIFYLIIPFIFKLLQKNNLNNNKKNITFLILLFIIEILFSLPFINVQIKSYSFEWWLHYISPISRIINLLIGFIFGIIFVQNKNKFVTFFNKLPKILLFIIEIFALSTIIIRYKTSCYIPGVFCTNGTYDLPMSLILIFVFGMEFSLISKFLANKYLVNLGKLSLSCYMLHQIIINYLVLCCGSHPWYNINYSYFRNLFNGIFILIIVLAISKNFQTYILNPGTKYLLNFKFRKEINNEKKQIC